MKNTIVAVLMVTALMLASCAGSPSEQESRPAGGPAAPDDIPGSVMETLERYEQAVRRRDTNLLAELVTDDIQLLFVEPNGQRNHIGGLEAVSEFRLMFFDGFGPQEDYNLYGTEGLMAEKPEPGAWAVGFHHDELRINEWFMLLETDDGSWRINNIDIHMHPPGMWITNRYQLAADFDGDGFLSPEEHHELIEMTHQFYDSPHPVHTGVDEVFDRDGNGFIDDWEIEEIAYSQFVTGSLFMQAFFPESPVLPEEWRLGEDRKPGMAELEKVMDFMLYRNDLPLDRGLCVDVVSHQHAPDAILLPVPREVSDLLDELADGNGDGVIDEREQEYLLSSLAPSWKKGDLNPLEQVMDRNRDGELFETDILMFMHQSASGRGMSEEGAEPPFEAQTPTDSLLDANRDGRIDDTEIDPAIALLSGQTDLIREMNRDMQTFLDRNGDGSLEMWEIEEARPMIIFPRPVDPDLAMDSESDVNRDGFIDPEELGITAGVTDKGMIPPFEEQIMMMQHRMAEEPVSDGPIRNEEDQSGDSETPAMSNPIRGSEYYRRLGTIQDKKLAVVALDIGTEKVDQETATGIIVFIENAFVNVGKVNVVDRAHIEDIVEEMEFQMSGAIDESTAVEVGKLSGADIIVIGSINRVGGLFYLNTKLIAVETAEIIGSSIAQADSASGFLEMANQAVYKLF